tara:strand:+ start:54 stop:995 length:942 start_codon:yes stop_codon:yes gene_type:complete
MVKNQTYKEVKIQANSRLHLGFLNLNNVDQYSYGGIGVSIDKYPTISLISKSKKFESNLSKQLNNRIFKYLQDNNLATDIKIECIKKPTSHIGLGSGTQLKLSIEELISKYYGITENINIFNRTYRSGIGLNTFKRGGFIIDSPKKDLNNSHMVFRNSFPAAWKAILIFDRKKVGLHGKSEKLFFSPSNSNDIRKQLSDILINKLVPAILHKDFDIFAKGLSKFQKLNHQFYSSVQKSMYSSSDISKVIKHINNRFIVGTGQSSWGPTSYMFIDSRRDLNDILSVLDRAISMYNNLSYDVVSVKNNGRKLTLT